MLEDRRIQKAISSYEVSKGWSTVFLFYGLLVSGVVGQLLYLGLQYIGVEKAEGYAWFLGILFFVAAIYFIINFPIIGLLIGGFLTVNVSATAAYFTYESGGLGSSLAVFAVLCLISSAIHYTAIEDLKNI
ncbi:hypothetical protein JHL22_10320 [Advenella sp. WQ 585]|uniref:Uncharacterized protein n=1 Tax=Advenella mandrilli TaxID=2800330 RepID=A0ABS1EDE8_9BURK|nr:hypothetical protein [Advenella mandrilli]MBK1781614.1 hypothetical protein [Advenella mandrilli]